jgi:hypothetical protein
MELKVLSLLFATVALLVISAEAHGHYSGRRGGDYGGGGLGHYRHHHRGSGSRDRDGGLEKEFFDRIASLVSGSKIPELIQFLQAMQTPEAQLILKSCKVEPYMIEGLIKKLQGSDADKAAAMAMIQAQMTMMQSLPRSERRSVRYLIKIYNLYLHREMAIQFVKTDSLEALTAGLTALTAAEQRYWFRGILFSPLLDTLKTKGEAGRKEVVDKMVEWIKVGDGRTLKKVGMIYSIATVSFRQTTTAGSTPPPPSTTPGGSASTLPPPPPSTTPASTARPNPVRVE